MGGRLSHLAFIRKVTFRFAATSFAYQDGGRRIA